MEETLRVKLVVDSIGANSSFKQINQEANKLSGNTNSANQAVQRLDKVLGSIGFRGVQVSGVVTAVKGIKDGFKTATSATQKFLARQKLAIDNFKKLSINAATAFNAVNAEMQSVGKAINAGEISNLTALESKLTALSKIRNKNLAKMFPAKDWARINSILNDMKSTIKAMASAKTVGEQAALFEQYKKSYTDLQDVLADAVSKPLTAIDKLKKAFTSVFSVIKNIIKVAAIASVAIAAIGAAALVKLTFSVSKFGDNIDDTSPKVGMSTKAFQEWGYVLERCGIEASSLRTSMRMLYRTASGNNKDVFSQLGINPEGLSKQQLFEQSVNALQKISDGAERTRMAYQLFGQASAELMPLLNTSSAEVERLRYQYDLLGAVMDGKTVRASSDLRDAITDLKAAFQGLKNTLGATLMPLITQIIIRLTVFIAKVNMVIQALFGVDLEYESVAEASQEVTHQAQQTTHEVQKLKTLISGFDELNIFPSQNQGYDLDTFLDELGDADWSQVPQIGEILPAWAIQELENFKNNTLPDIVTKIQNIINKINEVKDALKLWNEGEGDDIFTKFINWWWEILGLPEIDWESYGFGDFFNDLKTELNSPVFEDNSFLSFLNDLIDFDFENLFGDVDFENPFSLESLFGENIAHLIETGEWDWSQTGIGQFFASLKQEIENIGAAFRGEIEGETILEKLSASLGRFFRSLGQEFENIGKAFRGEIEGETILEKLAGWVGKAIRSIGNWDIFKKEWWTGKWQNIKDAWNNSKIKKFFEDAWGGIKTFFGGIKNWDIFKGEWWKSKWEGIKTAWNNSKIKKFFEDAWKGIKEFFGGIKDWDIFKGEWWKTKWENIKTGWNNSKIKKFFENAWKGIKEFFGGIKDWDIFKKEWWQNKWENIKTAWNNSLIGKFFNTAWSSLKEWFNNNVKPKFTKEYWQKKFESIKTGFNNLLIVKFFKDGWKGVTDWFNEKVKPKFTKEYWKNKFESIRTGFNNLGIVKFFKGIWGDVTTWFNEKIKPKFTKEYWQTKFQSIKDGFNNLGVVKFFKNAWSDVTTWFNEKVKPKFTLEYWKNKFSSIKSGFENIPIIKTIKDTWGNIKKWWNDNISSKFGIAFWKNKWNSIKEGLAQSPLLSGIVTKWNDIKKWFNEKIGAIFTRTFWQEKWNKIKEGISYSSILLGIKAKWEDVKKFWNEKIKPIFTIDWWKDKWNKIKEAFTNIDLGKAFKDVMNSIIGFVEGGINKIIDTITGPVLSLLKALGVLSKDFTLGRVHIPRLAKGGVIDTATVALVGEYAGAKSNPEIVTPESKMRDVFESSNSDIINVLVQGFRQIVQAIDDKDTSVTVDGVSLAKSVKTYSDRYQLMTGKALF